MKRFFYKYIYLIICAIILASIGIYGYINTEYVKNISNIPISFTIESDDNIVNISLYQADERHYYVLLPSYANMEQIKIQLPSRSRIAIDDIDLSDGMDCSIFESEKEYSFKVNNHNDMTLQFCQSANVATMYINTATGSMTRIHNDKDYDEPSIMTLILPNGETSYSDKNCYLSGRGNATWGKDKKPYSLTLSSAGSLLGMAPSSDWILLANSFDSTNLRNKIVYDLAAQSKLAWTPSCEYVDVYLNGSYNGLYLITERIEADSNHLDIDTTQGDFLCKVDHSDRWNSMCHPFKSSLGRSIEITGPKELTPVDEKRIQYLVNNMESALLSASDNENLSNIDPDSWVCKYLIDEISANGDADLASSYFYYKDGIFYAGPIWDYDNSFGNTTSNENPVSFTAKNYNKAPYYRSPYYSSLYANEDFYSRITQIYKDDFLPLLNELLDTGILSLSEEIAMASQMNNIRWQSMFEESDSKVTTPQELIHYLQLRVDFLNSVWIDNSDFCTVQFETISNGVYYNLSVIRGDYVNISNLNTDVTTWYNANTGEIFDFTQPIAEDISLVQQYKQ